MPDKLKIDDELITELVKRQMAEQDQQAAMQPAPEDKEGVGLLAKLVYGAGLGADAATTLYGTGKGYATEANPMLSWAGKAAVPVGAGMSIGGVLLAKKLLGKNHPKLMKGLLYGLGAMHGGAAVHNIGANKQGKRNIDAANVMQSGPPAPGMVQLPDGSFINPDYFGR